MLIGQAPFSEDELVREIERIRSNPAVMDVFPDAEPISMAPEPSLLPADCARVLLGALAGTGIDAYPVTSELHIIGDGPLRIATTAKAVVDDPEAACIDGLDHRQWALLRQLQRPGELLPLVCATAKEGPFEAMLCGWLEEDGVAEIACFADLRSRIDAWDGTLPPAAAFHVGSEILQRRAESLVAKAQAAAREARARLVARQHEAARLRLVDELGRLLICFEPDTADLNGKLYRMATEQNATALRLRQVLDRLGGRYPDWSEHELHELRAFKDDLSLNQIKNRLTGTGVDAALSDPRWSIETRTCNS